MDFLFRVVVLLQWILGCILAPFLCCRIKRRKSIPKITNDILKCSATVLSKKIRNKQITCLEVTEAYIDRIKVINPYINAIVEDRFADAIEDAKKVDKIVASSDQLTANNLAVKYPLLGVPVTIKESCSVKGLSYCVGSKKRIGVKATEDGVVVRKVREAGAIPLLVSNTPELCLSWECANLVTGRTKSAYNINCTSGGSSGGEGALLGCGASVIGVGSDLAGSIRLPATFNGIHGHKPTPKIISIAGHYPSCPDNRFPEYLVIGPLVRYAKDLKLMTKIMAENVADLNLDREVDLKKLNVYYMYKAEKSLVLPKVDKDIIVFIDKCLQHLQNDCGSNICEHKFDMQNTCEMSATLFYKMEDIPNVLMDPINGKVTKHLYWEILKALFGLSDCSLQGLFFYYLQRTNIFVRKSNSHHYQEKARQLRNDFVEKLGNCGVFLYPTFPTPSLKHDHIFFKTASVMYAMVFNILGLPATHVTLGKNDHGQPIGIQIIAAPYQDRLCFAVAEQLEKYFGGWTEP